MAKRKKLARKVRSIKSNRVRRHDNHLLQEELDRPQKSQDQHASAQDHVLDLQQQIGNKAVTRMLKPKNSHRGIQRTLDVNRANDSQIQRQVEPWKDKPSSRWAIRSLGGAEIAIGIGKLRLEFELKNRRSGEIYDAIYDGQVAGVAAGLSISMYPSWLKFGTAGKVKPDELSGLGAQVRALGVGIGIVGLSSASIKLPNVDTSPSRIDIGGINASFGFSVSAFYSGGEFRVYKKPDRPTA